uniref:SHSP domain-containing protein n=1 Tax=Ascaris lumbricoides TaxID=6252 RepID=A0A0M3HXQ3_ASCLU
MQLTPDELLLLQNSNKRVSPMENAHTRVRFKVPATNTLNEEVDAAHATSKGFFIVLDANGFQPKDFKVTVTRNCVLVSANARTSGANYGGTETLLRRRYIIPSNVLLGSISAAFTDSDVLIIRGNRADVTKTDIPVHIGGNRLAEVPRLSKAIPCQQTVFPADAVNYKVSKSFDI